MHPTLACRPDRRDGKETVMEITDSEETAKAEAAKLDREAERTYQAEQNMRRNPRDQ
jgi:hypothetical protein